MGWREQEFSGERKRGQRCVPSGWMLGKEEKIRAKRMKKKSKNNRAAFISLMVPEPLTQGKAVGVSGENKTSKKTPSLPRHFGRTSAVAVNLFVVPIGGRGLL